MNKDQTFRKEGIYRAYLEDNVYYGKVYLYDYSKDGKSSELLSNLLKNVEEMDDDDKGQFINTITINSVFFYGFNNREGTDYTYDALENLIDYMTETKENTRLHKPEFYQELEDSAKLKRVEIKVMDYIVVRDHLDIKHYMHKSNLVSYNNIKNNFELSYTFYEFLPYTIKPKQKTKKNRTSIFKKIGNFFKRKTAKKSPTKNDENKSFK